MYRCLPVFGGGDGGKYSINSPSFALKVSSDQGMGVVRLVMIQ